MNQLPLIPDGQEKFEFKTTELVMRYRNLNPDCHDFEELLEHILKGEIESWKYIKEDQKVKLLSIASKITDMERRNQEIESKEKAGLPLSG